MLEPIASQLYTNQLTVGSAGPTTGYITLIKMIDRNRISDRGGWDLRHGVEVRRTKSTSHEDGVTAKGTITLAICDQ